jgi:hypothetical protein
VAQLAEDGTAEQAPEPSGDDDAGDDDHPEFSTH